MREMKRFEFIFFKGAGLGGVVCLYTDRAILTLLCFKIVINLEKDLKGFGFYKWF